MQIKENIRVTCFVKRGVCLTKVKLYKVLFRRLKLEKLQRDTFTLPSVRMLYKGLPQTDTTQFVKNIMVSKLRESCLYIRYLKKDHLIPIDFESIYTKMSSWTF